MTSILGCRWFRGVVAVVLAASFIALPGCGGSQSNKVSMPDKKYEPLPPESHQDLSGGGAPKRAMK